MRNLLFFTLVAGCFNPDLTDSMFACTAECPSGFECLAGECVRPGTTPSITILEPANDKNLSAEIAFTLSVQVENLNLHPTIPDEAAEGEGHWHWFIDDVYQAGVATESIEADPLDPGCHILKVDLRQNDHVEVDPPVSDQVSVYSSDGGPTICIVTPPVGENLSSGENLLEVDVRNFVLDDTLVEGHGHWHAWVDNTVVETGPDEPEHFFTDSATITLPNAAKPVEIKAELVDNNEDPLDAPRSATVTVTVQ